MPAHCPALCALTDTLTFAEVEGAPPSPLSARARETLVQRTQLLPAQFRGASAIVQAKGSALVVAFLTRHAHRIEREAAREVVDAALAGYKARAFGGPEHLRRAGAIVVVCLERLAGSGGDEALVLVRRKPIQRMLSALIRDAHEVTSWTDAALLLLRAEIRECLPEILRSLQHAPQDVRLRILQEAQCIVGDRKGVPRVNNAR